MALLRGIIRLSQIVKEPIRITNTGAKNLFIVQRVQPSVLCSIQYRHLASTPKPPSNDPTRSHVHANDALNDCSSSRTDHSKTISNSPTNRIVTIPNILTFSRICISPVIGYLVYNEMHSEALACFAFAAVTDLLDGFIARKFQQGSELGSMLDPIADKLLLTTCLISLCQTGIIPLWFAKGLIYRDIIILTGAALIRYFGFKESPGFRRFFDFQNYPTRGFHPTMISKCNTALLCGVIAIHLSTNHLAGTTSYDYSIFGLHLINAALSTASLTQYISRVMKDDMDPPSMKVRCNRSLS